MSRFGVIGGAYQAETLAADNQSCVNLMAERDESGAGKSDLVLINTPGLENAYQLPDLPVRAQWTIDTPGAIQRSFAIGGSSLCELLATAAGVVGTVANGGVKVRGAVPNDGKPASITSSNIQLMIASGGKGFCYTLATDLLSAAVATINGVVQVLFLDGFFAALIGNSAQWFVSGPLDGNTWDPLQTTIISRIPDNVVSMALLGTTICFGGKKKSVCYYNSGGSGVNTFPFDVMPGGTSEQGSAATFGVIPADNTLFGIWGDDKGGGVAFRANGYTFQRISTHAVELAWQGYATIADAVGYAFQHRGHTLIHWYFPTANKSWRYDVSTSLWHEVKFWDAAHGVYTAHRSCTHTFFNGKHLVGDWASGSIYQMSNPVADGSGGWKFVTDFGNAIRRERTSPYVGMAGVWNFFYSLEIMADTGLGPNIPLTDGSGNSRGPQLVVTFSDDCGHTWSNERVLDMGQIGQFKQRLITNQLGSCWGPIGRLFRLTFSDPAPLRIVDADLQGTPEMRPQKRLAAEIRERA